MYKTHNSKNRPLTKLRLIVFTCLILVLLFALLEITNITNVFHHKPDTTTGGQYTKGITGSASGTDTENKSAKVDNTAIANDNVQPGDIKHQGDVVQVTLLAPTGTFANTYQAHVTDQMGSTCNTSPGATCQIIFTNGNVTKSLPIQTADRGGATYWSWTPQQIGLSSGSWHIDAKAVLGSQIKTTSNGPLTLEILE